MKAVAALALVGVMLLVIAGPADARLIQKDFDESFDVSEGVRLYLTHGDGDVTITPWTQDIINVKVRYRVDVEMIGWGKEPDFDVEFRSTDDAIYVAGKERDFPIVGYRRVQRHEYSYTISAPSYAILHLNGDDGDIVITDWNADIDCRLDDGDISLTDVSCDRVQLELDDGDVEIVRFQGSLKARTDDGDITVFDGQMKDVMMATDDGDIDVSESTGSFEIQLDDGDATLRTVDAEHLRMRGDDGNLVIELVGGGAVDVDVLVDDGDVSLRLRADVSAMLEITMDDGSAKVDLPQITDLVAGEGRVTGRLGDGEGSIRIQTDDGTVRIREATK
ncbi:DUF4097 family beta strand repeat protein [bacterium]|nr:DUF4097 family beta strand repeat protein [bacterium]